MEGHLADLPLHELLERFAARTPAPGGGSAVAVTCALAAGLVEMAAAFSRAPEADRLAARAGELRSRALDLAEVELSSYAPVLAALSLPASDPERPRRMAAARSGASEAPLRLAETGAELAELASGAARTGSPHVAGDAITAALLAEGACRSAAQLVAINLHGDGEDPRPKRAGELSRRAAAARAAALEVDL
jgi:methenyltetrahydrofolate cyclohydrolase